MKQLKGIKEIIFISVLLLISIIYCDDVNSYNKKVVQIKNKNSGKCLVRTSLRSSRIVQSACNYNDPNSLWFLILLDDSKWKIASFSNNLVYDVRDSSKENLAALQIYTWANTNNQKWWINNKGGDYWEIKSTDSSKCIDVHNSKTTNLNGIVMYTCSGGANQLFSFHNIPTNSPSTFKQGAVYKIRSGTGNACLQFTGNQQNLFQNTCDNDDNKKFKIYSNNDGSYTIKAFKDLTQSTDIFSYKTNNGAEIKFWTFSRSQNQKVFIINAQDQNKYYIRDVNSGKCFDRPGGTISSSKIQLWECQDNNFNQYWFFDEVSNTQDFEPNQNKLYKIVQSGSNPTLCITNSRRKASPLTRGVCNNNDNSQLWKFTKSNEGYIITSYLEAKSLTVLDYSPDNFTPVVNWNTNGDDNQRWIFRSRRDIPGIYGIVSSRTKKCLQFPSDINEKLVSLHQFDCWDFASQEFTFEETDPSNLIKANKPYRIFSSVSNKCLKYNGNQVKITQEDCDGSDGTKFAITRNSNDGTYYIQPFLNMSLSLTVDSAKTDNGTKIQAQQLSFSWNQKFFIFGFDNSKFYIRDGNSDKCIDLSNGNLSSSVAMQIWECGSSNSNQSFVIQELPILLSEFYNINGYIQIMNFNSSSCLAFNSFNQANQVTCNKYDESSFWMLEYNSSDDTYYIKSKINNNYLDNNGGLDNNNPIIGGGKTGNLNQKFKFEFDGAKIDSETKFTIKNLQSKKCLSILNNDLISFSSLVGNDCYLGTQTVQFKLIGVTNHNFPSNGNYYSFKSESNSKCIKFNGIGSIAGNLECDESNLTMFKLVSSTFGSYYIISDSDGYLSAGGSDGSTILFTNNLDGNDNIRRFFITGFNSTLFIIRHYQSNLCISNEGNSIGFKLKKCDTGDLKQGFGISEAVSQWENIYVNGESCSN